MANTAQAKKRAKQALVRRERNFSQKSAMRTAIKKVLKAVQTGDKAVAQASLKEVSVLADRAVNKKLIHAIEINKNILRVTAYHSFCRLQKEQRWWWVCIISADHFQVRRRSNCYYH